MPVRDKFPKEYFEGNPYDGETPEGVYERIRWGNEPSEAWEIEAPEDMATMGDLAMVVVDGEEYRFGEDEAPFMAIGVGSNRVYLVPKGEGNEPRDIPEGPYERVGVVEQIDYYSDKGGEEAYYYHEHEAPFPTLWCHVETGVCVLVPAEMEDGSRSYAVGDEGVVG